MTHKPGAPTLLSHLNKPSFPRENQCPALLERKFMVDVSPKILHCRTWIYFIIYGYLFDRNRRFRNFWGEVDNQFFVNADEGRGEVIGLAERMASGTPLPPFISVNKPGSVGLHRLLLAMYSSFITLMFISYFSSSHGNVSPTLYVYIRIYKLENTYWYS